MTSHGTDKKTIATVPLDIGMEAVVTQIAGNERLADGVIYIAEEASGQVIAYGLPWNSQLRTTAAAPQIRTFVALDYAATRFVDQP
jgi:hypothetical protein